MRERNSTIDSKLRIDETFNRVRPSLQNVKFLVVYLKTLPSTLMFNFN